MVDISFDKSLEELDIAEAAYLAALPKAPNNYHPVRQHDRALERRNWVIERMREDGFITSAQALEASATPLSTRQSGAIEMVKGSARSMGLEVLE